MGTASPLPNKYRNIIIIIINIRNFIYIYIYIYIFNAKIL